MSPQISSLGWVDPVPDPLLLRKSGSAGNRTRGLCICSQELWPLDHRGGHPRRIHLLYKPLGVSYAASRLRWTLYNASDISKFYFKHYLLARHLQTPLEVTPSQIGEITINEIHQSHCHHVANICRTERAMALVTAKFHVQWISWPLLILSVHNALLPTHPPLVYAFIGRNVCTSGSLTYEGEVVPMLN
jgi:hypothetical protein